MTHRSAAIVAAVALGIGGAVFRAARFPARLGFGLAGTLCAYTLAIMFFGGVLGDCAGVVIVLALILAVCVFGPREYDRVIQAFDRERL